MRNLLLTLSFDGTEFHGWQTQKNAVTVQEVLGDAIFKACGERVTLRLRQNGREGPRLYVLRKL